MYLKTLSHTHFPCKNSSHNNKHTAIHCTNHDLSTTLTTQHKGLALTEAGRWAGVVYRVTHNSRTQGAAGDYACAINRHATRALLH